MEPLPTRATLKPTEEPVSTVAEPAPEPAEDSTEPHPSGRYQRLARIAVRLAGAAAIAALAYTFLVRPWHLRWGATDDEVGAHLPGDDFLATAKINATHAITIDAPASAVWPWLVQMGQGRGGLYSYDWLENLVGCDIHSADVIVPELQNLQVDDTFRLGPQGYPFFTVASIDPERSLLLWGGTGIPPASPDQNAASWAFILRPINARQTRLVIRFRSDWEQGIGGHVFNRLMLEPIHFIMERKMMYGIRERCTSFPS